MEKTEATYGSVPRVGIRWIVVGLLFILTIINYADRGVIGVVAPLMIKDLHLSIAQFGVIASAFGWGYSLLLFVSGAIVTFIGPRRVYLIFVTLWSIFIAAIALAGNFVSLLVLRLLFGASEGTIFPTGSQMISNWVNETERATATGLEGAGIPLGSLIIVPIAVALATAFGWQAPFVLLGVVGLIWVAVASKLLTNTPAAHTMVKQAELEWINSNKAEKKLTDYVPWGQIAKSKTLWIAGLAFFSSAYVLYFLLTFFPTYLVKDRHIPYASIALLGSMPWIAMTIGAILSGIASDFILRRSSNLRVARSIFAGVLLIITGLLIFSTLSLQSTGLIVAVVSIASFFNFMANPIFFAIPIDALPQHAGPAGALTTGLGSLAGIAAPLITGFLVQSTGNFASAFLLVALLPIFFGILLIALCKPQSL